MPSKQDTLREIRVGKVIGEANLSAAMVSSNNQSVTDLTDDDGNLYVMCGYTIGDSDALASPVHPGERPTADDEDFGLTVTTDIDTGAT